MTHKPQSAYLRRGPSAGYTATLDTYPIGNGWWHVTLIMADDIHGRDDSRNQREYPDQYTAQIEFEKLAESLKWASTGPIETPITA